MELFRKKIGPVFVKENSDLTEYIGKLRALREHADENLKQEIDKQIKYAQYGEAGEKNIAFELKNSGMDMMILHDLYFESEDLAAQIDYIVITRKVVFVIECKNLYGNIKIDNRGTFIRLSGGREEKGMYSPVTQNERHLQLIKKIRLDSLNMFQKKMFEKNFDSRYQSVIVLANPQTVLKDREAPKEVKEKVIRYDQLIGYIRKANEESSQSGLSADEMKEMADFFMKSAMPSKSDYTKKFQVLVERSSTDRAPVKEEKAKSSEPGRKEHSDAEMAKKAPVQKQVELQAEGVEELVNRLKAYRLQESKQNHIKPYYIFNDEQMKVLINKKPKNAEELLNISGFGPAKVEKYGEDILKILHS
ncbi:MAG: NERD domain-containing protein [Clostridium sp.]|nr:NERD domain-containing protein [Clostridium sp.]